MYIDKILTYMNSVYPGNTYDYSPYNASVQAQLYNNLYGKGNCLDQINDCAARGIDEICEAAVRCSGELPRSAIDAKFFNVGRFLCQLGWSSLWRIFGSGRIWRPRTPTRSISLRILRLLSQHPRSSGRDWSLSKLLWIVGSCVRGFHNNRGWQPWRWDSGRLEETAEAEYHSHALCWWCWL